MRRRIVIIVGTIVLLLIAVLTVFLAQFDATRHRQEIAALASRSIGRSITIGGELDLALFPLRVVLHDVRAENAAGGTRPEMAIVERLDLGIALAPLVFERRLVIDHLHLAGVDLLLERDSAGHANWELAPDRDEIGTASEAQTKSPLTSEPDAPSPAEPAPGEGPPALPRLHELSIERAEVRWRDEANGRQWMGRIDRLRLEPRGETLALDLLARWRDSPITLAGTIGSLDAIDGQRGPWPVRLTGDADGTQFEIEGTIAHPLRGEGIELRLAAKGVDLSALSRIAGVDLPALRGWAIEGRVTRPMPDRWALEAWSLSAGNSRLSFDATVDRGTRPNVVATIAASLLDLGDFGPASATPSAHSTTAVEHRPANTAENPGGEARRRAGTRAIPAVSLPFETLSQVDAAVAIHLQAIKLGGLAFDEASGRLRLADGVLDLTLDRVGVRGGRLDGSLALVSRDRSVRLRLRGAEIPLGRLLAEGGLSTAFREGATSVDLDLEGHGETTRAVAETLGGVLRADVAEAWIAPKAFDLAGSDLLSLLRPLLAGSNDTQLHCAVVRFDVRDGIGRSRVLAADASRFSVAGGGMVDLRRERVAIDLEPRARESALDGVAVPVRIRGALSAPSVEADATGAIGSMAGSGLTDRLRESTGLDLSNLGRALRGDDERSGQPIQELSCAQARALAAGRSAPVAERPPKEATAEKRPAESDGPRSAPKQTPVDRLREGLRGFFGR